MQHDTIVDVGCGPGQSTFQWCPHFKEVIGIDISVNQIALATEKLSQRPSIQNLKFQVGPAESLPFADKSVDMLSFGTCWHWMKFDKVIPEIQRVLKRPGCVAIYNYLLPTISHSKCNDLFQPFQKEYIAAFFQPMILNGYRDAPHPFPLAKECNFSMNINYTPTDLYHFVESISVYTQYKQQNPDSQALTELIDSLDKVLPEDDKVIEMVFPVRLLLFKAQ